MPDPRYLDVSHPISLAERHNPRTPATTPPAIRLVTLNQRYDTIVVVGAWDEGLFDNDSAADLLGQLLNAPENQREGLLFRVLRTVVTSDYLDVFEAEQGVAAAGLVALQLDPGLPLPAGLSPAERYSMPEFSEGLVAAAGEALRRVCSPVDNDWYDVWDEAQSLDEVMMKLQPYRQIL